MSAYIVDIGISGMGGNKMDAYLKIKLESKYWKDINDIDDYQIVYINKKFYGTESFYVRNNDILHELDDNTYLYCFTIELFNKKNNPYFVHCENDFYTELDDSLDGIFLQVMQQKNAKKNVEFTVKLDFISTYMGYPDVQEGQGYFEVIEFKQLTNSGLR